jgi:hypothetical protein
VRYSEFAANSSISILKRCDRDQWYGHGYVGLFVALFIYSKIFELVDTLWLVLKKRCASWLVGVSIGRVWLYIALPIF